MKIFEIITNRGQKISVAVRLGSHEKERAMKIFSDAYPKKKIKECNFKEEVL